MKTILQAISGRLSAWKRKFGMAHLRKFTALLHARFYRAKNWAKEHLAPYPLHSLPATFRGLRKSGVLASLTLFALILFMGHSATVAWLTYTTPTARNSFQVGQMDLSVEYRNDKMPDYALLTESSSLFHDEALYEPGYTQVVYLHVKNNGTIPFDYRFSVQDYISIDSKNVYGGNLHLPDFLYFGMVTAASQTELENKLATRASAQNWAQELASEKLGSYAKQGSTLAAGQEEYAALVVYMPWYIGNEANCSGDAPQVILGLQVYAQQAGTGNP